MPSAAAPSVSRQQERQAGGGAHAIESPNPDVQIQGRAYIASSPTAPEPARVATPWGITSMLAAPCRLGRAVRWPLVRCSWSRLCVGTRAGALLQQRTSLRSDAQVGVVVLQRRTSGGGGAGATHKRGWRHRSHREHPKP